MLKQNLTSVKQNALIKEKLFVHQIIMKVDNAAKPVKHVHQEGVHITISIKPLHGALTTILKIHQIYLSGLFAPMKQHAVITAKSTSFLH